MKKFLIFACLILISIRIMGGEESPDGILLEVGEGLEMVYLHREISGKLGSRESFKEHFRILRSVTENGKEFFYAESISKMKGKMKEGSLAYTEEATLQLWIDKKTGLAERIIDARLRRFGKKRSLNLKNGTTIVYNETLLKVRSQPESVRVEEYLKLDGRTMHTLINKNYKPEKRTMPPIFLTEEPEKGRTYGGASYVETKTVKLEKANKKVRCHILEWEKEGRLERTYYDAGTGILVKVEVRRIDVYTPEKELVKTNLALESAPESN